MDYLSNPTPTLSDTSLTPCNPTTNPLHPATSNGAQRQTTDAIFLGIFFFFFFNFISQQTDRTNDPTTDSTPTATDITNTISHDPSIQSTYASFGMLFSGYLSIF